YALGAVLYECLTGRPPFVGDSRAEVLAQILGAEPVPPRRLRPRLPRDLETVCLKCLQKEPARRYPSAAALASDLRRFLDGRPAAGGRRGERAPAPARGPGPAAPPGRPGAPGRGPGPRPPARRPPPRPARPPRGPGQGGAPPPPTAGERRRSGRAPSITGR